MISRPAPIKKIKSGYNAPSSFNCTCYSFEITIDDPHISLNFVIDYSNYNFKNI